MARNGKYRKRKTPELRAVHFPKLFGVRPLTKAGGKKLFLDKTEEERLFKQIAKKQGNVRKAKERIVGSYFELVRAIARREARSTQEYRKFVREGRRGLEKAIDRYQFGKGYRFATYATWFIKKVIAGFKK